MKQSSFTLTNVFENLQIFLQNISYISNISNISCNESTWLHVIHCRTGALCKQLLNDKPDRFVWGKILSTLYSGYSNLPKGRSFPKVQDHENWKGHFSFVSVEVNMELIQMDLVGILLSSSTQKVWKNLSSNINLI